MNLDFYLFVIFCFNNFNHNSILHSECIESAVDDFGGYSEITLLIEIVIVMLLVEIQ